MRKNLFDHIAFATANTEKSMEIFSILGFKKLIVDKQKIEKFGTYITKIQSVYGQLIELVEPFSKKNVVHNLLSNCEATMYHAAFYTSNLQHSLIQLRAAGAIVITEPMLIPYPATKEHIKYKTSHVFHPNVGLFEITGLYGCTAK